jgi:hypothetical protein
MEEAVMKVIFVWRFIPLSLMAMLVFASEGRAQNEALLQASRLATKEFGATLKERLTTALEAGGPLLAIDVCKTAAGEIAADMSRKHGLSIRRTALRVRNDDNAPDPFERQALARFVKDISAGKDAAGLEHVEVVSTDTGDVYRYMKAIPTAAEPCLACHGTNIGADVRQRLRELYPNDQATGFKAGELRGAFSVSVNVR